MNSIIFGACLVGLVVLILWLNNRQTDGIHPELLQATRGNRDLARRLLEQARIKYPGKSERWYREKIIYDLERDGAGAVRRNSQWRNPLGGGDLLTKLFTLSYLLYLLQMLSSLLMRWFR